MWSRRLDDFLGRHSGRLVVVIAYGMATLVAIAFTFVNTSMVSLFLDLDRMQAVRWCLMAEAAAMLGLLIGALTPAGRRAVIALWTWRAVSQPPARPTAVYEALVGITRRQIPASAAGIAICEIPIILVARSWSDGSISSWVIMLGTIETIAGAALFLFLLFEILLRPLLRRLQEWAPPGWVPPRASPSLRARILVAVPTMTTLTGYYAVALAGEASVDARVAVGILAAILWSLTMGLILTATLSQSLSEPVAELVRATEDVERGRLDVHLRPIAGDEISVLGHGFNRMVEGLRAAHAELRASRARVVAASDAARRRFERDVHDGAQQQLVLVQLKVAAAKRLAGKDPDKALSMLDELEADTKAALADLRDLAHGLYPAGLAEEGLVAALTEAARRSSMPVRVAGDGVARHGEDVEAAVYFTCLEALQNATKHGGDGAKVTITVHEADSALHVSIADDGVGFDASRRNGSHGLQNMADRLGALGGTLSVASSPGRGTTVSGRVPLSATSENP